MTKPLTPFDRFKKANGYDKSSWLDPSDLKKAWLAGQACGYQQGVEDSAALFDDHKRGEDKVVCMQGMCDCKAHIEAIQGLKRQDEAGKVK